MFAAAKSALQALRSQHLLSFQHTKVDRAGAWTATTKGAAIYQSALPTDQGAALYSRLREAVENNCCLWDRTHLIYLAIQASAVPTVCSPSTSALDIALDKCQNQIPTSAWSNRRTICRQSFDCIGRTVILYITGTGL